MRTIFGALFFLAVFTNMSFAYPEFQRYSNEISGRSINCAICHMHPDGPEGIKPGQIGSLNEDDLKALGVARQALKPGAEVKNPVLNEFGNSILNQLGKEKILELKQNPQFLAEALSQTSDLDGDGVPDVEEFQDGTHPLNSFDGRPLKLFKHNLFKNWFHILMIILATCLGLYSIHNFLYWLSLRTRKEK